MRKLAATTIVALALPLAASLPGLAQQGSTPAQQMQPSANESSAAVNLNPDQIRQLQQSLNDNGFDAGKVDGVFGPSTRAALRQFQSKAGLPPTGELDAQTLTAVGHGDKIGAPAPAAGDQTTGQRDMSGQPAEPASPNRSPSQQ
jgi:peptidoglycan hydrolase-like protein with peptidoglycan-binding domain